MGMWSIYGSLFCVALQLVAIGDALPQSRGTVPLVTVRNGTLEGYYEASYRQEFFLGIPYASPPVGHLRFQLPKPAQAWHGTRKAEVYGSWCLGNSVLLGGFSQNTLSSASEDCLFVNVIRPAGVTADAKLPVLVWIHGGGFDEGSAADQRYNGSFLVQNSVQMKSPILFVSFNYRLGLFGTIAGPLIEAAGLTNLLLRDQRQTLTWVQENIAQFGGDASRVTIMGESAGALSVAYQLVAFGGRDDGLFRAAITESGGPLTAMPFSRNASERATDFNKVLNSTGCASHEKPMDCLRQAPADSIRLAGRLVPRHFTVDGDILPQDIYPLIEQNRFVKVPLLIGSNRNEGASFAQLLMTAPFRTDADFAQMVRTSVPSQPISNSTMQEWLQLYQQEVTNPSVAGLGTVASDPGPAFGPGYGRMTLWLGDQMFTAGRRFTNRKWARNNISSYGYFFDAVPDNISPDTFGSTHFQEIPYVFGNSDPVGWNKDPFPVEPVARKKHQKLAQIMSRMWISFVATCSPNFHGVPDINTTWPVYSMENPTNLAFSVDEGATLQPDNWRSRAIDLLYNATISSS